MGTCIENYYFLLLENSSLICRVGAHVGAPAAFGSHVAQHGTSPVQQHEIRSLGNAQQITSLSLPV
jgi:hypothetical protein